MTGEMQGYVAAFGALLTSLIGFEALMEGERYLRGLICLEQRFCWHGPVGDSLFS